MNKLPMTLVQRNISRTIEGMRPEEMSVTFELWQKIRDAIELPVKLPSPQDEVVIVAPTVICSRISRNLLEKAQPLLYINTVGIRPYVRISNELDIVHVATVMKQAIQEDVQQQMQ